MSRWSVLVIGCALAGIAAAILASITPGRLPEAAGLATFGCAGVVLALEGFVTRRQLVPSPAARYARYEGTAAAWGSIWLLCLGVALIVVGISWASGAEKDLLGLVVARPGIALVPFGLSTLASGVAGWQGWRLTRDPDRPLIRARVGGAASALFGAILLGVGLMELAVPAVFDSVLGAAWDGVLQRLQGPGTATSHIP